MDHIHDLEHDHEHCCDHDPPHTHEHCHDGEHHTHAHVHDPKEKKRQINRLSRVIGHLEHIKVMIDNDEDCSAVLIQISAAKSALNGLGKQIINEHISHCIAHAVEDGDRSAIDEFQKAIQKYL